MILAHPYTSIGWLSHPVIPEPSDSLNLVKLSSFQQAERLYTRAVRWGEGATAVTAPWLSLATNHASSHTRRPWSPGARPCAGGRLPVTGREMGPSPALTRLGEPLQENTAARHTGPRSGQHLP